MTLLALRMLVLPRGRKRTETADRALFPAADVTLISGLGHYDVAKSTTETSMWPRTTCMAHVLPSWAFAAAATRSGSNPNFLCSSLSGAEAPNVCMPMI